MKHDSSLLHLSHVHRGGGKFERPDNTLDTFRWCWENGSALECDCRRTRDGIGIMLHDATLRRTARGIPESLADTDVSTKLDYADIKDIDVGSYLSPDFAHHRIPTIKEVFNEMKRDPKWLCFVDEKGAGTGYIARVAREQGVFDQVYYSGCVYQNAINWTTENPGGKTMIWIGTWPVPAKGHPEADAKRFRAHFESKMEEIRAGGFKSISVVSLHTYYDPSLDDPFVPTTDYLKKIIGEFHDHGIPVCSIPFEGGETEEVYFKLFDLGCDGFSSDYPSVMFSVIKKLREGKKF